MVYPFKLPKVGVARFCDSSEPPVTNIEYEDVIYCPETMSYKTATQERQIQALQKELELQKVKKKKSLDDIISYFYKR